jgi:UDP-N-acetylmuramoyl-L-alanyl-D-glutamate--2,6-diaminopimelate ligase
VIAAARARKLRVIATGRKANGAEGIRLVDAAIDGFAQKLVVEHRGRKAHHRAAAGR